MCIRFLLPIILVIAGSGLTACSDDRSAVEQAEKDVLATHDEVMPQMDDLMKVQRALKTRLAGLDSTAANESTSEILRLDEDRNQARRLLRDLHVADSLMTHWMGQYRYDALDTMTINNALRYLDQQKASITDVKTKVNESLDRSRQFLANQ